MHGWTWINSLTNQPTLFYTCSWNECSDLLAVCILAFECFFFVAAALMWVWCLTVPFTYGKRERKRENRLNKQFPPTSLTLFFIFSVLSLRILIAFSRMLVFAKLFYGLFFTWHPKTECSAKLTTRTCSQPHPPGNWGLSIPADLKGFHTFWAV